MEEGMRPNVTTVALAIAMALLQPAAVTAQGKFAAIDAAQLDRLAAIIPDPSWTPEQQQDARAIAAAAGRLSAALKAVEAAEARLHKFDGTSRGTLQQDTAAIEREIEEARTKVQKAKAQFQALEQRKNQTMQMLSQVLKTMHEMRGIGGASRSGF
jgi:hypothetical protein